MRPTKPAPQVNYRRGGDKGRPLSARIAVLERRLEHLRSRGLDPDRRNASRSYDMAEAAALEDAVEALQRYRAEYQLGTTALDLLRRLRTETARAAREGNCGCNTDADVISANEDTDMLLAEMA